MLTIGMLAILGLSDVHGPRAPEIPPTLRADTVVDAPRRARIVDSLVAQLTAAYVFPEKVEPLARELRARVARGRYDHVNRAVAFADTLSADLRELAKDRHLAVRYSDRALPRQRPTERPRTTADQAQARDRARTEGFGLGRVELLADGIGILEVLSFGSPAEVVEEAYAAAMTRLAGANVLVIDVRGNGGGNPNTVALLSSYLFGTEPVHLNSIYWRADNRTEDFWTRRSVSGPRFGAEKPVVVLTSARTFSAAEEFAYNLQARRRAMIIGEVTRGGANPGQAERLEEHFLVFVPTGRAINPITKTNWEGVGVRPEVSVAADKALDEALRLIRTPQ